VPSFGAIGDSFDNALAETVNGYSKAELIYGPAGEVAGARVQRRLALRALVDGVPVVESLHAVNGVGIGCRRAAWRRTSPRPRGQSVR